MTERRRVVPLLGGPAAQRARLARRARSLGFLRCATRVRNDRIEVDGEGARLTFHPVGDPAELHAALAAPGAAVLLRWRNDRVIPLESAIAERPTGKEIWAYAARSADVPAALGALQHGADAVVVPIASEPALVRLSESLDPDGPPKLDWRVATISAVVPIGSGDRVLVDTVRFLPAGAGFLVGSSAARLFLVASEAGGSAFSGPRPFRVNAGPPHSYVLCADGRTAYLSEVGPGTPLLLVRPGGRPEAVRVGRVKIELRPLVMVEARVAGRNATVFLQEAETVRLVAGRRPVPVTRLRPGDRVRAVALPAARHLGRVIDERIEER